MTARCAHLEGVTFENIEATECPECVAAGDTWVHLRACIDCGHIGCCDSSVNKHASAHAGAHGHTLVRSAEPGELWVWCYEHEVAAKP